MSRLYKVCWTPASTYNNFLSSSDLELWKEVNLEKYFIKEVYPNTIHEVSIEDDIGDICLYLMSIEDTINSLNLKDTVFSNKVCVFKKPLLFIPQAFTPNNKDAKNDVWKIIINGENTIQSFNLKIYNSFGQVIFETNSVNECWDGTFKNSNVQFGVYTYILQIYFENGKQLSESGTINLLR